MKLCECGCKQETTIHRGKARKFIHGHSQRGKKSPNSGRKKVYLEVKRENKKVVLVNVKTKEKVILTPINKKNLSLAEVIKWKNKYPKVVAMINSPFKAERELAKEKAKEINCILTYYKKIIKKPKVKLPLDVELEYLCGRLNDGFYKITNINNRKRIIPHEKQKSICHNK